MLNLGVLPALAADPVTILDKVAESEQGQLDLQVPADTPIGHHIMTIEILDDAGVITSRDVAFCKDTQENIQWDDNCPDVLDQNVTKLEGIFDPIYLPDYDPTKDVKNVNSIVVAAFALLAAVSTSSTNSNDKNSDQDSPSEESIEDVKAGARRRAMRVAGRGDRSRSWDWPWTNFFDREFGLVARDFSPFSPLLARILQDGNYLRAMIGGLSVFLYPVSVYIGLLSLHSNTWQPTPVLAPLMIVIMGIGIIDSLAGYFIAMIFTFGMIVSDHFHTRQQILGTIGIIIIWFAPGLIASSIRPLRRDIKDSDSLWERISDYALASLLSGWVVQKMVGALPGLIGKQIGLTSHSNRIAVVAGILVALRFILEDVSDRFYPQRNNELDIELKKPLKGHEAYVKMIKVGIFFFFSERYIGNSWALWVATFLMILPSVVDRFDERFPKRAIIGKAIPKGAPLIVIMSIVGSLLGAGLAGLISNKHILLQVCFVVLSLPSLTLSILDHFAQEPSEKFWRSQKRGQIAYRLSGIGIYVLLVLVVLGKDLAGWITALFN